MYCLSGSWHNIDIKQSSTLQTLLQFISTSQMYFYILGIYLNKYYLNIKKQVTSTPTSYQFQSIFSALESFRLKNVSRNILHRRSERERNVQKKQREHTACLTAHFVENWIFSSVIKIYFRNIMSRSSFPEGYATLHTYLYGVTPIFTLFLI